MVITAAVFGLSLAIYTLSLAPGIFAWDSAELTLGIYTQGIVHATGYPLYLLLGRLFTLLPLSPEFAVRVNLFSALTGALTVAVLYRVAYRLVRRPLIAAASALLFGFAQQIWAQAVVAEVYLLHTLLIAAVLLLLLRWLENPDARALYAIFFCLGLAFANHMSSLLVALALMPYLLWRTPRWRERAAAVAVAALTTALLYLYLPIRYSAQPEFNLISRYFDRDLRDPAGILWMMSGQMFGAEMFAYPLLEWLGEIAWFVGELWLNFLGVGLLVGALGVYRLWVDNRALSLLLAGVFGVQVLFFTSYGVFDKSTMFHTAYLVWSIYVAVGFRWLSERLSGRWINAASGLLVAAQVALNWNVSGRSGDYFVQNRTEELLRQLPPQAMLIGPWTTLRPVEYFQIIHHQRADLELVDVTLLVLGVRDRLAGAETAAFDEAVDAELRNRIDNASAEVYVVDPDILSDDYETAQLQADLYRVLPK